MVTLRRTESVRRSVTTAPRSRRCEEQRTFRRSVTFAMVLDGVGRVRAEQIVLHRVRYEPFRELEDLLDVDGIGTHTLARLRLFCEIWGSEGRGLIGAVTGARLGCGTGCAVLSG